MSKYIKLAAHYIFIRTYRTTPLEMALVASAGLALGKGEWGGFIMFTVAAVVAQEIRVRRT